MAWNYDGRSGKLSENAFAWRGKKPIISLNTTGGSSEKIAGLKIDDTRADKILSAETPRQAFALIMDKLSEL